MPFIDPDVVDRWIRARLLEQAALTDMVGARIHPLRGDFEPLGWPFVLYHDYSTRFDNWAEQVTLRHSDYRIFAVMREDKLSAGVEIREYLRPAYEAIAKALDGVSVYASPKGYVHSCQVIEPIWRYYGEQTKHVAEMGVVARIVAT